MTAYRPSNVTVFEVRLFTVIQYVTCSALARSTATDHETCGEPGRVVVGMTVHKTCQVAGQLKVNQRRVSLPARLPFHCTPQSGCVIQPSTGISQTPRLRVPALSTRACGWKIRSPTNMFGRLLEKS